MISKKIFTGGINGDDTDVLIQPTEYLNALNVRFATTENGKVGEISNVEGNVLKAQTINAQGQKVAWTLPAGTNTTIGAIEDTPYRRIFFFNKNSNGNHGIYCYDADTDTVYNVLLSNQVKDGLNFSEDIHSIAVIDNLLYWTDNVNPQRRINVEAGIKSNHPAYVTSVAPYVSLVIESFTPGAGYTPNATPQTYEVTGGSGSGATVSVTVGNDNKVATARIVNPGTGYKVGDVVTATIPGGAGFSIKNAGILPSVITLIRNQPWKPILIQKKTDPNYVNNFIKNEAFEFAYRFVYRDFEVSTFSPLSALANYNTEAQNTGNNRLNVIGVTLPSDQKIDQDVIRIEVAVRFVVGGKYFIIKSFDNQTDFSVHNSGLTTPLKFDFYNDTVGIAVDDATAFKQFDSVPLKSETLEIARSRLFLGNNTDGYETPKSTSLAFSTSIGSESAVYGDWTRVLFTPNRGAGIQRSIYVIYVQGISQPGYYGTNPDTTTAPGTGSVSLTNANFPLYWPTFTEIQAYLDNDWGEVTIDDIVYHNTVTVTDAQVISLAGNRVFKSDSSYRLGVVFYDEAGRKSNVVTRDDLKAVIADRTFNTVSYTTGINWSLSNNPSTVLSEIPAWAKYYSIVMTKCLRTSFFLQLKADAIKWVTKDTDGNYVLADTYSSTNFGLAVDAKSLYGVGLGYKYEEGSGDLIKIYPSTGATVTLSIKDTWGTYVICDNYSVTGPAMYEIYTPYIQGLNEPYYERAQLYEIKNPGLANREYSVVAGTLSGDVTLLSRGTGTTYLVEAMSPSDLQWKLWNTDAGRSNIVLDAKETKKKTSVCFSNVIILGSQTNGLSTFDVLDQVQLPYELSSVQKLYLVNKIESEGTVMLAIGEQETASIYLGETQVFDNTGSSFLAKSSGVIGNVNVLRGSYGTINPESVTRYMGNVYWFDANKGAVVSYSNNGLFPISSNKMQKYFRKVGQDVLSKSLKLYGGVDPYHNEVLMFVPRRSAIPEGPRLTDMELGSTTYSFTTYDPTSTITVVGSATYTFNGSPIGPNQSVVTGSTGAVTYSYSGTGATVYGPSATRPTQPGTYQVIASVESDGIYNAATSAPFAFGIQRVLLPSTIAVVGQSSYTFANTPLGPNEVVVTGSTGAVTYTYVGVGGTTYGPSSTRPTQVGSYSVTATVAKDDNYDTATSAPFAFAIEQAFVFDADYMLLTYQFLDGRDLDTRTRVVTPNIGQTSQPTYVGWGVNSRWPATGTPILDWGGDNTGTGFESVLINVAELKTQYPGATTLLVDLRAFWFGQQGFQPVNVAAKLWKGGTPIKQGPNGNPAFSFTNPTAIATLEIQSVGDTVTLVTQQATSSGERVATLTYNLVNNTGSFSTNDTTTPSV